MLRRAIRTIGVVLAVLALVVGVLFVFPLGSDRLQQAQPNRLSFDQGVAVAKMEIQQDSAGRAVTPGCETRLKVHPQRTAKAVLMLHGYTDCPASFDELAQVFFDRGYNVYVPRESHHGLTDASQTSQVSSETLVDYADRGLDVVAALGDDVGVIGLSGGGVLATWLAQHRTESVAHLLALSPFYQPDASQAPSFVIKPLIVLFGNRLIPDRTVGSTTFTLSGLSQYLRIVRNYPDAPRNPALRSVAVAVSATDPFIDRAVATEIPSQIADANQLKVAVHEFPAELNLPHNIVAPGNLGPDARTIEDMYVDLYEGRRR